MRYSLRTGEYPCAGGGGVGGKFCIMLYLNSCPKCLIGAIKSVADWDGDYLSCLSCGFTMELATRQSSPSSLANDIVVRDGEGAVA